MKSYTVAVLTGERQIEHKTLQLPQPSERQLLIQVDYCAICTLEQRIFKGMLKRGPFAGGHEVSGRVAAVGESCGYSVGDKVVIRLLTACGECYYCRSGHENQCVVSFSSSVHEGLAGPGGLAEYMLVDAKSVYRVDESVDPAHAALAEPLACCIHSVRTAAIEFGDDVVVLGAGIMGLMHVQLAKLRGARVIVCEVDEARLRLAEQMGADVTINSARQDAVEAVLSLTEGRGADAVFCTAAHVSLAEDSIRMCGKLGRVVLYSSFHPAEPIPLDVNKVHSKEPMITGAVNPNTRDFLAATRLISNHSVDLGALISGVYPLSELSVAFERAIEEGSYRILVKCS